MNIMSTLLDVSFLLLAILFFRASPNLINPPTHPTPTHLLLSPHSTQSTPQHSPLPNIPVITLSHHSTSTSIPTSTSTSTSQLLTTRPSNKRKSVSFSITSLDDIGIVPFEDTPKDNKQKHRRPPTPFIAEKGLASPMPMAGESGFNTPISALGHCGNVVDSMGVQKSWLRS